MGNGRQLRRGHPLSNVIVLSGGLDSTVCLALAAEQNHPSAPIVALTFDYGQRHRIELERARAIAEHYGAEHIVVCLDTTAWGGSALTDDAIDVPEAAPGQNDQAIPVTYVPARNLIFLSVAVGIAEARNLDTVTIGVNALDYSGYPDCRPEFLDAFATTAAKALKRGVEGRPVTIDAPLLHLTKADIVALGIKLDAPLDLTWSCYRGDATPCGTCDACVLRARGFAETGVDDPANPPT